jgi:hypothetical protein
MRLLKLAIAIFACVAPVWSQAAPLKTADAVLDRYKQALGGVDAIGKVQSETVREEIESAGAPRNATSIYYAKPFKTLMKVTRTNGSQVVVGFDGSASWSVGPQGASITKIQLSRLCAAMPICNIRSTSLTTSRS